MASLPGVEAGPKLMRSMARFRGGGRWSVLGSFHPVMASMLADGAQCEIGTNVIGRMTNVIPVMTFVTTRSVAVWRE